MIIDINTKKAIAFFAQSGKTLEQIGKETNLHPLTVYRIVMGRQRPLHPNALAIAKSIGASLEDLLLDEGGRKDESR